MESVKQKMNWGENNFESDLFHLQMLSSTGIRRSRTHIKHRCETETEYRERTSDTAIANTFDVYAECVLYFSRYIKMLIDLQGIWRKLHF
jgi:hypothetical protein